MKRLLSLVIIFSALLFGENVQKHTTAKRFNGSPKIDGILDDIQWKGVPALNDFLQYSPNNGEQPKEKSEAWIGYDNKALYIAAKFYDSKPDEISRLISARDEIEMHITDLVSLVISPFDDNNNALSFVVSSTGVQLDRKCLPDGSIDVSWDAIWESATSITDDGWMVEIKIPYSALRFPVKDVQDWGFNIWRKSKRNDEWSTWSYVDNQTGEFFNHYGIINGIEKIKPPLRLSFMPYVSGYIEKNSKDVWGRSYNAGMDVKYGINESYTLDMILIPDFGQIQSDDQELNLSPYELRFNEKRQFFTEGTELFNKGGIFYSRRIGSTPAGFNDVANNLKINEKIEDNPTETKLINAVKLSGRSENGIGIGVFNAMTSTTEAEVLDTLTNSTRNIETQPFTNYNMFVIDKVLTKNSYISLINTNVARKEFMANVTATEFRIANAENSYAVNGTGAVSYRNVNSNTTTGYSVNLAAAKLSGQFKYRYSLAINSDKYDPNDMGYLRRNNEVINSVRFDYNIYKPFGNFLELRNYLTITNKRQYKPGKFADLSISYQISTTLKNRSYLEMHALWRPVEEHDFYEARVTGRELIRPKGFHNCFTYRTDMREQFSVFIHGGFFLSSGYVTDMNTFSIMASPTLKINNRASVNWDVYYGKQNNEIGFVENTGSEIIMGARDVNTVINTLSVDYMFNKDLSISLRGRHYWSAAKYENLFNLKDDGNLSGRTNVSRDELDQNSINYNAYTLDATIKWNFAPGSQLSVVWKNSIYTSNKNVDESYFKNFKDVMKAPQTNSLSLKMIYYVDFLSI